MGHALNAVRGADAVPRTERVAAALKGVGKVFTTRTGSVEVLRDFNLEVRDGEFLAIVGPSGSGKSTVLNLLAGLEAPTAGAVFCHGKPITGVNAEIGYLTQHDSLLPWLTVAENIAVPLEIKGVEKAVRDRNVADMIANVGLTGFEHHHPSQLSGGMRKRAMLARTLIYDPPTIMMDEPFGPLDAQLKLVLQADLLRLWSATGKTVVFVTHDIVEAITLADRVIVLSRRPSRIKLDEVIGIGRPRDVHEARFANGFEDHYRRLWAAIEIDGAGGRP
jgi:NitT/TauT family transport system ATP-binding protein